MFLRIINNSFSSLLKNFKSRNSLILLFASIIGSINPFFLLFIFNGIDRLTLFYSQKNYKDAITIFDIMMVLLVIFNFFPFTLLSMELTRKVIEEKESNLKHLKGSLKFLKRSLIPSLFLTFMYATIAIMFNYTRNFYLMQINNTILSTLLIIFIALSFLILIITEYFFCPFFVYNSQMSLSNIIKYSMETAVRNTLWVFLVFLTDLILLIALSLAYKVSTMVYFLFSNYLRIFLYKEVMSRTNIFHD